ncbi:hypothetical protein C8F01DRAFT_1295386 [Mycena amicta]|nr:hypothetical protein C8F01DRAFT_1295386 [Mycena amicta]
MWIEAWQWAHGQSSDVGGEEGLAWAWARELARCDGSGGKKKHGKTRQACSSSHQRCSERESQSESDEEAKIGRSKPRMAFTSRTRTKGSVAHEGTTDAPRNGEVLKKEFWNEGMSRPVPKAPPGFRKGEEEPENTKGKNRVRGERPSPTPEGVVTRRERERDTSPTHEGVVMRRERSVNHPRGCWCATRRGRERCVAHPRGCRYTEREERQPSPRMVKEGVEGGAKKDGGGKLQGWTRTLVLPRLTTRQACSSSHQRCSERESQSESDEEAKIGRSKPRMAFTSRTRTKGSVAHEGTTDAPRNGEVLKKEFWNEGMSRPVPKAPPGFRKGEEEPENTKQERSYQEPKARERANQKRPKTPTGAARKARRSKENEGIETRID